MAGSPHHGLRRLQCAFKNSAAGLAATWHDEEAFRQESLLLLPAIPLALWLGDSAFESWLMIASLLLLQVVELLNTAVESVVDRIGLERHPLSGKAKDQGSAAVLIAMLLCLGTWAVALLN